MAIGKTKGYSAIITKANTLYDESVNMFVQAEIKISEANGNLDGTIEEIDASIKDLQEIREAAIKDKERNVILKTKLQQFTAQ